MPFSESSKHHLSHIRELETLIFSSARREYSTGNEPQGYGEYWQQNLAQLYLVSIYIYINEVAGSEKFWNKSPAFSSNPELVRCLEVMRLLRNKIVHSGGVAEPSSSPNGQMVRNFEIDVGNADLELQWQGKPIVVRPFFSIDAKDHISIHRNGLSMIRFLAVAALEAEGVVNVVR